MPENDPKTTSVKKSRSQPETPAKFSAATTDAEIKEMIASHGITEILLREHYVTEEDIAKAEAHAKKHAGSIADYLISERLINNDLLGQAMAESLKLPYADLNSNQPPRGQVLKIPEEVAKKYHIVLFLEEDKDATIATDNPAAQDEFLPVVKTLFKGKKITVAYSLAEDIEATFVHYRKGLDTRFAKIITGKRRVAPEIIDEIIADALVYRASDIHLEPQDESVLVRFRIDGVLHEAGRIPSEYYENILNRIKVQARLRLDEHFSAQDGSLRYSKDGKTVDMRISIIPTLSGEKIATRILGEYVKGFDLQDLGLSPANETMLTDAAKKPFGMILVTGPTGSGKTTTLYALIKILNNPEVNITTIEEPVEYKITGINQIQVNQATNLTFAQGLRSIVRQDPNIILVGEIRDTETAEIGVNAALTGHLLLSTFHANDAATAIPRLLDMEVEPFLLASTLELLIAQRLVRRICEHCRYSMPVTKAQLEKKYPGVGKYFSASNMLYQGKGCAACGTTSFKGRIAVFEFIKVTPELRTLILGNPSTQQIWEIASKSGSRSLFEDGIEKVKSGITTIDELMRVAQPPTA